MKKKLNIKDIEPFIDDQCSPAEKQMIVEYLADNSAQAAEVRELQELNRLIQTQTRRIRAPESLRKYASDQFDPLKPSSSLQVLGRSGTMGAGLRRRELLIGAGGALAAGLAVLTFVPKFNFGAPRLNVVGTFFHDFETYLLKDSAIDIKATNMVRLANWFSSRVPFSLPPISSMGKGTKLIGGRLCWLLERRLASLSYQASDGPLVIYIMQAKGLDLPPGRAQADFGKQFSWHRSGGNSSLVWKSDRLVFVMVGKQEVHRMMSIARSLLA